MTSFPAHLWGWLSSINVKFRDFSLNRYREIPNEAAGGSIYFPQFFRYNFRPEVDDDAISSVAVDNVAMDVYVKLCDSRSNGLRYIRGADFNRFERTNEHDEAYPNRAKLRAVSP